MSFPASLVPAARSAYRQVVRSARITFHGDPARQEQLLSVVRTTFRSPTLTPPQPSSSRAPPPPTSCSAAAKPAPAASSSASASGEAAAADVSEEEIAKRIEEWKEIAVFLRKNVVQGVQDDKGAYKLRVTPDTELGDNATIREPPKLPTTPFPNRNRRRRSTSAAAAAVGHTAPPS